MVGVIFMDLTLLNVQDRDLLRHYLFISMAPSSDDDEANSIA